MYTSASKNNNDKFQYVYKCKYNWYNCPESIIQIKSLYTHWICYEQTKSC